MKGEVIGMNSAIATRSGQSSGIGFAIPSNRISRMLPTLIKGGRIARGLLGVGVQDLDQDLAKQFNLNDDNGALVTTFSPDSAAAKAGIQVGDAITRMDGQAVANSRDLRNRIGSVAPGSKVRLSVMRDGKELQLMATIGEAPTGGVVAGPAEGAPQQAAKLGLSLQPLTPDLAQQLGLTDKRGLVIIDVDPGSAAARAGLQQGDLILEVKRKPVNSVAELNSAVASSRNAGSVLLLVKRTNASMFVALPAE
jgi:serine protease Do